jgi:hypothetical protein
MAEQFPWYVVAVFVIAGIVGTVLMCISMEYPHDDWLGANIVCTDPNIVETPDRENFCEYNSTESEWHLNKTAFEEWQFRMKFGVDR